MCANGSKMIQGQDFTVSYALTVDADSFRLSITIAALDKMIVVFIDASNAFQTHAILDPNKRYTLHFQQCVSNGLEQYFQIIHWQNAKTVKN